LDFQTSEEKSRGKKKIASGKISGKKKKNLIENLARDFQNFQF
jgi:hypothetical protein